MNALLAALSRHFTGRERAFRTPAALACSLALLAAASSGCSDDASSPLEPSAAPPIAVDGGASGGAAVRVAGSLLRAPHSWPIVNWSSIRDLNATVDREGNPDGTFELDIEIDFGDGPFLQETTEEVICLEIAERDDGSTDIWISSSAKGWVTVPPGVTHFAMTHIVDSPDGDLTAGRSILPEIHGDPADVCENRPDLVLSDPMGLGAVVPMAAEAGNVVSLDRR